jgi:hypothetical protein
MVGTALLERYQHLPREAQEHASGWSKPVDREKKVEVGKKREQGSKREQTEWKSWSVNSGTITIDVKKKVWPDTNF